MKKILLIFLFIFLILPISKIKAGAYLVLDDPSDYLIGSDSKVVVYLNTNILAGDCFVEYSTDKNVNYGTSSVVAAFDSKISGKLRFKAELSNLSNLVYFYRGICISGETERRSNIHILYKENYINNLNISINEDLIIDSGVNTKINWSISGLVDECNLSYAEGISSPMSSQKESVLNEKTGDYSVSLTGLIKGKIYKYQVYCVFINKIKESPIKTFTATTNKFPDLKIDNIYFSPTPDKENYFSGNLNIPVYNIGKDKTNYGGGIKVIAKMYKPDGSLIAWNIASSSVYIDNLEVGATGYAYLPIENIVFNMDNVLVKTWVDNAENEEEGYIKEINENNNYYEKSFSIGQNQNNGTGITINPITNPTTGPVIDPTTNPTTEPAVNPISTTSNPLTNLNTDPVAADAINKNPILINNLTDAKPIEKNDELYSYEQKASFIYSGNMNQILENIGDKIDVEKENENKNKYIQNLKQGFDLGDEEENAINKFITYGADSNTKGLGAGERAAVIFSFKEAFKKLPISEADLSDVIKIANGRWPAQKNNEAERKAKDQFIKIYKRIADMEDLKDNAAITVMAYGLRQKSKNRNLDSERNGINIFKGIYGYGPKTTEGWNIMQAITYSGASRGIDTDGDLLTDEREKKIGTNLNNPDSDGDGYIDGVEVDHGYNPLN